MTSIGNLTKALRSGLIATATIGILAAAADAGAAPRTNDRSASTRAIGGATGNARVLAFVNFGGGVVRSKGISAVTHPSVGQYCLALINASLVNVGVPTVSVDWSNSSGNGNFVQWRSSGIGCPAGNLAVLTFQLQSGGGTGTGPSLVLADTVAFSLIMP